MTTTISCTTRSRRSAAEMFDRARDIDLHTASQRGASERAIAGTVTGLIGLGEEVTWRARHLGLPFTLTSRVTAVEAPRRFVDEQIRGPFALFRHEHLFEDAASGSVMTDRIAFSAPFGILGRVVERPVLRTHLLRLLEERGRFLAE